MQSFDKAAAALNEDWGVGLDGKQVQRWAEKLGGTLVRTRNGEVAAFECGVRPPSPANAPSLLVLGMDGGRVQMREADAETGNRWREDKVLTATSYLPGEASSDRPPKRLVTTYVATMGKTEAFGRLVRVEAERRGLQQAQIVLVLGDGGNWIDPLAEREFLCDQRIVDYYHAVEHLYAAADAALGRNTSPGQASAEQMKDWLWDGQVDRIIETLEGYVVRLGPPEPSDGPDHPRRVLANNVGYFQRHRSHMDYPTYRRKGWPIGSGVTEAGVKQFNRRVKGTDQFWQETGVEAILALRALWLSDDGRWTRYWSGRPAYREVA